MPICWFLILFAESRPKALTLHQAAGLCSEITPDRLQPGVKRKSGAEPARRPGVSRRNRPLAGVRAVRTAAVRAKRLTVSGLIGRDLRLRASWPRSRHAAPHALG